MPILFRFLLFLLLIACTAPFSAANSTEALGQTIITVASKPAATALQVVIYTISTCPHCREAKEYLNSNNIPFINREVDTDDKHFADLMRIYDEMGVPEEKRGVPLLVIGNRIRIQGFNKDKVQRALKEVSSNPH